MAYISNSNNKKTSVKTTRIKKDQLKETSTPLDTLSIPDIQSKTIDKTFGREDDYIELHVYNNSNQLIHSENYFEDYIIPTNQEIKAPLTNKIQIDPNKVLNDRGFFSGQYIIKLNILKNKIFNTDQFPFRIKEISSDRREIKSIAKTTSNTILDPAVSRFIADIESAAYFKEFSINFGEDTLIPSINILLNKDPEKHEIFLKTLNALPSSIKPNNHFRVVEEITDPLLIRVDLGNISVKDEGTPMGGPNFHVDVRLNNSIPSEFKAYDDILNYSLTSSYQHLLSKLEDDTIDVDIKYDYIRPVSKSFDDDESEISYHFENFVHFSSATERLKNFEYKLKLVESYDKEIGEIENIAGGAVSSSIVVLNKNNINDKKVKTLKGLDGYEQFLYFDSGTFAWPKQNDTKPYTLYSVTSSEATTWLGKEYHHATSSGQLLSASLYDKQNEYSLNKLIPTHITDNSTNNIYSNFVNMVGHHFDHIWTYIKALSKIKNTHHTLGISKDLVYHQLKSIGFEVFDQFENASLTEYMLGMGSGSNTFDVGFTFGSTSVSGSSVPSETMVTASNEGSLPKGDITKEIWKRIYHNAPYLLKTKGTERGIKALMSCYGLPASILNVKEYGGSTTTNVPFKDLDISDNYKTFTYEKQSLASYSHAMDINDYIQRTNWSSSLTDALSASAKTVEFRIKPTYSTAAAFNHLFTLKAVDKAKSLHITLEPYTGNDISSSNDVTNYGRLRLIQSESTSDSLVDTQYFPIYNGNFWNIHIGTVGTSGSAADIQIGAYQSNHLKNITYIVTQSSLSEADRALSFGDPYSESGDWIGGAPKAFFGGSTWNGSTTGPSFGKYIGSMQEIRYHFGELLSHNTLKKHALAPFMYSGNTLSSSYENLIFRAPLGSNDKEEDESSFHPNIDVDYINPSNINSNITAPGGTPYVQELYKQWQEIVETHHLPTPDTVGASMTSEKVRIDEGTVDDNILSPFTKGETSTLDRQPQDFEDLGIFFSPTDEINEDILYTLGSFRMDDYIGSPLPSAQSSSIYEDLSDIKDVYVKKVKNRYNYWDYIKQIQYIDHTLFKMIEQFVPARANLKTGLVIEPHFLERNKFKRTLPVRSDAQTMTEGLHQTFEGNVNGKIYTIRSSSATDFGQKGLGGATNIEGQHDPGSYLIYYDNFIRENSGSLNSNGRRKEQGTNATIGIYDDYINPANIDSNRENQQACQAPIKPFVTTKPEGYKAHESSVLLGNMIGGKKSNKYYKYAEYNMTTSSLYINQP